MKNKMLYNIENYCSTKKKRFIETNFFFLRKYVQNLFMSADGVGNEGSMQFIVFISNMRRFS